MQLPNHSGSITFQRPGSPSHHRLHSQTTLFRARRILKALYGDYQGPVVLRLWTGEQIGEFADTALESSKNKHCIIHFNHPGVLRELILYRSVIKLAEAFIRGDIDVTGNLETLFHLETHARQLTFNKRMKLQLLNDALHLPPLSSNTHHNLFKAGRKQQKNSRKTIAHHYDIGNDFYQLWLDKNMLYSCAYFRDAEQSLDQAQQDKLDYLCRKLRLQPGQTLLDIGCGWGALAMWAAQHYGVKVHGITLSQQQQTLALARVKKSGLEQQVRIELRDYRNLPDKKRYDRIVSVGMFEHIGIKNFSVYFSKVKQLLKPEGLFLNHGITSKDGWRKTQLTCFMNQYIFPDGELARISEVNAAMEKAGFEVVDVESLRRHYALTLRRWIKALESHKDEATQISSAETYRLWRLYMAGCAHYFEEGSINVYQVLAGHQLGHIPTPLRREDLYINKVESAAETPDSE